MTPNQTKPDQSIFFIIFGGVYRGQTRTDLTCFGLVRLTSFIFWTCQPEPVTWHTLKILFFLTLVILRCCLRVRDTHTHISNSKEKNPKNSSRPALRLHHSIPSPAMSRSQQQLIVVAKPPPSSLTDARFSSICHCYGVGEEDEAERGLGEGVLTASKEE